MTTRIVAWVLLIAGLFMSLPVSADPPPWAPAHGYRAKHDHHGKHRYRDDVVILSTLPFGLSSGTCNRELLGSALGGAAGGLIGSQIGSGSGRTVATVTGVVVGVLVGGAIGRSMDRTDQNCIGQVLEHVSDRQTIVWDSPTHAQAYRVTPTRTFRSTGGRYCRDYTANTRIGGRLHTETGIACRRPDGAWVLLS